MTWSRTLGREQRQHAATLHEGGQPSCPVCGGRMWDNRARKTNPKAPDFKCRTPDCTGRIWPGQLKGEAAADVAIGTGVPTDAPTGAPARSAGPGPLADAVRSVVEAVSAQTLRARMRSELRACYLDATEFVLAEVRPKYEAAGVPCTDATVAAITATLFIATCNRGAVGPGADADDTTPTPGAAA
jgi:hypothetical protein